jgi:hypothetical protein
MPAELGEAVWQHNTDCHCFLFVQVDVIGISISEIVHPQDISELASVFKTQGKDSQHG